jgi:hypothetical protein
MLNHDAQCRLPESNGRLFSNPCPNCGTAVSEAETYLTSIQAYIRILRKTGTCTGAQKRARPNLTQPPPFFCRDMRIHVFIRPKAVPTRSRGLKGLAVVTSRASRTFVGNERRQGRSGRARIETNPIGSQHFLAVNYTRDPPSVPYPNAARKRSRPHSGIRVSFGSRITILLTPTERQHSCPYQEASPCCIMIAAVQMNLVCIDRKLQPSSRIPNSGLPDVFASV